MTAGLRLGIATAVSEPHQTHPAQALLAQEARLRVGPVPAGLGGAPVQPGQHLLHGDAFLLRTEAGLGIHYRRGDGVTLGRQGAPDPAEEALWLNGSVYAAIAAINGLMPVHASAVAHGGRVIAFTGPSGAGKSTLVAALGGHGLPLFADDTLLLDIAGEAAITCLPGHKRLKLTEEALKLTGAERQKMVGAGTEKFFATPSSGAVTSPLPLGALVWLDDAAQVALTPLAGAERIVRLNDDHYTADLFARARGLDAGARFALLARLAPRIAMFRLARPRDPAQFATGVATVAQAIREGILQ